MLHSRYFVSYVKNRGAKVWIYFEK